jgi:flagellar motor component MotA
VVQNQFLKLLLFLEHRTALLSVGIAMPSPGIVSAIFAILFALGNCRIAHQPGNIISFFLVVTALIPCVIHTQQTS